MTSHVRHGSLFLGSRAETAVKDLSLNEVKDRTLEDFSLTCFLVEVEFSELSQMASHSHTTTVLQVTCVEQRHQPIGVVEGDGDRLTFVNEFSQQSDGEPGVAVVLHDFGVGEPPGDGEHIEGRVRLVVRHEIVYKEHEELNRPMRADGCYVPPKR